MILLFLILILLAGGALAWITGKWSDLLPRVISLVALSLDLILLIAIYNGQSAAGNNSWWIDYRVDWIPTFGISLHLAIDGLSMLLLALTMFIGLVSVLISWKEIHEKTGFFHFNILWILSGISGVFLSMDLFLFYFFWELMLVPMYFLISIWGHENRIYASYKFFIYTQASGLLMFLSIIALYFIHGRSTGIYTFDYIQLLGTTMAPTVAFILMSGFLAAFLVKLPVVPFHNWLPDAHTEAPTAGSVILAGLLLKTGAYGLIRFVLPLFPEASVTFAPAGMILGVIGILYGAKLAFAQTDLKRLVAYTSVSHMGFVILGVYAFNEIAMQGVVVQMIAHALSTGALFILVGQLYERIHTRDMDRMGGLWKQVPVMGATGIIFAMASLGLPGLGNFIAEFLILAGTFQASILMTCLACAGLVAATIYSLRIVQKVFLGKEKTTWNISDLSVREKIISASLVITLVYLGMLPQQVIDTAKPSVLKSLNSIEQTRSQNTGKPTGEASIWCDEINTDGASAKYLKCKLW
ncbi:MAG: NADH-quinone oxidoreductase subunit M [Bacteroidales bacterium]|nr:NADH-quinone oxidoreductase subunit M [Bacteroidales bacterium]